MKPPPFQRLLDTHREEVYRFLLASVGPGEADDCFQETFLAALRAYPRLRHAGNLRGWLYTIAHRKVMDVHRRRRRERVDGQVPDMGGEPSPLPRPDVWAAVRQLPSRQRAAVVLRHVADLPFAEIGRIVGCSEEAARQNVRAGIIRLREELEP